MKSHRKKKISNSEIASAEAGRAFAFSSDIDVKTFDVVRIDSETQAKLEYIESYKRASQHKQVIEYAEMGLDEYLAQFK